VVSLNEKAGKEADNVPVVGQSALPKTLGELFRRTLTLMKGKVSSSSLEFVPVVGGGVAFD